MSDSLDLEAIDKALDAATPGPWRAGREDMQSYDCMSGEAFTNVYTSLRGGLPIETIARAFRSKADASLIANAPTWLRSLLDEVRRLRKALRQYGQHNSPCLYTICVYAGLGKTEDCRHVHHDHSASCSCGLDAALEQSERGD